MKLSEISRPEVVSVGEEQNQSHACVHNHACAAALRLARPENAKHRITKQTVAPAASRCRTKRATQAVYS